MFTWHLGYVPKSGSTWMNWAISHTNGPVILVTPIHGADNPSERNMVVMTSSPSGKTTKTGVNLHNFMASQVYTQVLAFSLC